MQPQPTQPAVRPIRLEERTFLWYLCVSCVLFSTLWRILRLQCLQHSVLLDG